MSDTEDEGPSTAFAATSSSSARRAKRKAEHRDARFGKVLDTMLTNPDGREFFMWLLQDVCGYTTAVANAAFDPHALHFREGARNVGLTLHREALRLSKEPYMVALRDHMR